MKFRHLIRALGTQFMLGHGFETYFPFGMVKAQVYRTWKRLQVEFLATGFELLRINSCGTTKAYCFLEMKIFGNILRIDTEARVSFLCLVSYIKDLIRAYEYTETNMSDDISEGSQI